jgi:hypothetical protein
MFADIATNTARPLKYIRDFHGKSYGICTLEFALYIYGAGIFAGRGLQPSLSGSALHVLFNSCDFVKNYR